MLCSGIININQYIVNINWIEFIKKIPETPIDLFLENVKIINQTEHNYEPFE